jgi:hypothetical protein
MDKVGWADEERRGQERVMMKVSAWLQASNFDLIRFIRCDGSFIHFEFILFGLLLD